MGGDDGLQALVDPARLELEDDDQEKAAQDQEDQGKDDVPTRVTQWHLGKRRRAASMEKEVYRRTL